MIVLWCILLVIAAYNGGKLAARGIANREYALAGIGAVLLAVAQKILEKI